jgi:hypothetical protein
MGVPGRFGRKAEDRTNSRSQESEFGIQNDKAENRINRFVFLLASGFWILLLQRFL